MTINGRRLDSTKTYNSAEEAIRGGLEDLRNAPGMVIAERWRCPGITSCEVSAAPGLPLPNSASGERRQALAPRRLPG